MTEKIEPMAAAITEKFGGAEAFTKLLNDQGVRISSSQVRRWSYAKPQGTGGWIPIAYWDAVLAIRAKQGRRIVRVQFRDLIAARFHGK